MSRRHASTLTILAVVLASRVPAQAVPDSARTAVITYIAGPSVYVGAGRADGLNEGMTLDVFRGGRVIGTLRAAFLSSRSASCEVVASIASPAVGDSVRFRPAMVRPVTASIDSSPAREVTPARETPWRRAVRGHVGLRYLRIEQPTPGNGITQPSADLHVEATRVGGTPFGFVIDGRGRRSIGARSAGASDERMRVYESSTSFAHDASGVRLSVGRQYSAALAPVSLFDGATLEVNRPRWAIGGFTGLQPDAATMGFSTTTREAGGYVQVHNALGSTPWSFTAGGIGSRELGQLNREFAFAQVLVNSGIVTVYATQEVDVNRGWKRDVGEPALSPTSSFAMAQVRVTDALVVQGGIDNRRNVRLYRDFVSPESEFDDTFRQGAWGGATLARFPLRIAADVRASRGGGGGRADFYTGSIGLDPVSSLRLDARLRSTSFRTDMGTGWLHAWSASAQPVAIARIEVNGGLRTQQVIASSADATSVAPFGESRWLGFSADVSVSRSWYVLLSGTRDGSAGDWTNQVYASLLFRF